MVILLCALTLSIAAFASSTFSFSNKHDLNALGSAINTAKLFHSDQKNDANIVYGGEDVSRNINAMTSTALA